MPLNFLNIFRLLGLRWKLHPLTFNSNFESFSLPPHQLCSAAECSNSISSLSPPSSFKVLFKNLSVYEIFCLTSPAYLPTLYLHYETEPRCVPSLFTRSLLGIFPFIYWLIHHQVALQPQPREQQWASPGVCSLRPSSSLKIQDLPRLLDNDCYYSFFFLRGSAASEKVAAFFMVAYVGVKGKNKNSESELLKLPGLKNVGEFGARTYLQLNLFLYGHIKRF